MVALTLKVTSHVGRDLLQSAQLFRHEHAVVWEYVSNGLQYKDSTTKPTVIVEVETKARRLQITDNGRGMRMHDLHRYFQMHGENLDRKQGRPGRGFFGTGKSAGFGVGNSLTITTVREGRRSKVTLTRKDIEAQPDGNAIPIKIIENEVACSSKNGTVVEIEEVFLKNIDIASIIRHIERHIAHWPDATVIVNNHECEFSEPDINRKVEISSKDTEFQKLLGDVALVIKVAKAPLEDEFRGIAVLSNGVWHETTLAGCDRKPFAEYLFGTIDVPSLGTDSQGVSAFDMSRSMKLNPRNEIVADTIRFVGINLDAVRKDLERLDRQRRQSEEQKRLQEHASKIADLINNHFKEWSSKLRATMAKAGTGRDLLPAKQSQAVEDVSILFGAELSAVVVGADHIDPLLSPGSIDPNPIPPPNAPRVVFDEKAEDKLGKKGATAPKRAHVGGFNVAFEKIGRNEKRAKYDKDTRTIFINLEHPRIALELADARGQAPIDDPHFQRMAYEIAFTEYAIVLGQELGSVQYYLDAQDALVALRQTLDELSKAFANVWTSPKLTV